MFTIDNHVEDIFPGTKAGILIMKNISVNRSVEEPEIIHSLDEMRQRYGHLNREELKKLHPILAYTNYYKKFRCSYPVIAQLESVLKGRKTPHAESGLLQAMFLSELESMLLTAGHDLSKLQLPLQLKVASGDENYRSISEKDITTVEGDLMICDGMSVISSIMRGPDFRSRITASTTEVLFTIYAPPGIETDYIETDLRKLEERIKTFSSSSVTMSLQVFSKD
ncbi:MAG: hypothetical protein PWQ77_1530 [Kosmotogales bacterium]|nr:hypothetical protein [Kosmotogales bacterium]